MICDGCVVMTACKPRPGAVAISRLDSVAELRKRLQVIFCWVEKCLGQSLWQVTCCEVVVVVGKRSVRKKLAL